MMIIRWIATITRSIDSWVVLYPLPETKAHPNTKQLRVYAHTTKQVIAGNASQKSVNNLV